MSPSRRLAALVLALAAPAALAAEPQGAAGDLARIVMPRKTWELGTKALADNVRRTLETPHQGAKMQYPADFEKKVQAEIEGALPYEELLSIHAKELSATYAEPELKDLVAFYRSPVGQKWLEKSGEVSQKVSVQTQQRIEGKMQGIMERLSKLAGGTGTRSASPTKTPSGHPKTDAAPKADAAKKPAAPAAPAPGK